MTNNQPTLDPRDTITAFHSQADLKAHLLELLETDEKFAVLICQLQHALQSEVKDRSSLSRLCDLHRCAAQRPVLKKNDPCSTKLRPDFSDPLTKLLHLALPVCFLERSSHSFQSSRELEQELNMRIQTTLVVLPPFQRQTWIVLQDTVHLLLEIHWAKMGHKARENIYCCFFFTKGGACTRKGHVRAGPSATLRKHVHPKMDFISKKK